MLQIEMYESIEKIIENAGKLMISFQTKEVYEKEGPANFVTSSDIAIQKELIQQLSKILPEAGFFGEEDTEGNNHCLDGYTFYIDPIDGTTNYLFDYKHSCVSVGLAQNGKMIAGWVYKPYTDEMWYAYKGEGAFYNEKKVQMQNLAMEEGIVAFGCARYNDGGIDQLFDMVKKCFLNSLSIRNGGSSALDLCRIASGNNILYFEFLLQPYDYAAASIIIEEAGGLICQVDGSPIRLDQGCSIVGGTPKAIEKFHSFLMMD